MTQTSILTTRPLAQSDFAAWFSLWTRYLHHTGRNMPWTDRAALFRALTQPASGAAAQVVECAGKMVGFAHCQVTAAESNLEKACHIQDFYVIPVFQAMRAGAALMREVYRTAQDANASAVYWLPSANPCHRSGPDHRLGPAPARLSLPKAA